ncbi:hydrolase, alpha/beta hydrolase fold family [Candidatus Phaeomarinobacter ectocarpi]|uniref:Hydrolase, alpha/beta hydrolase fold family n=2 Tax=Candidatus Phaeomarinibacter ectocarpi TaxID=1458461 RepID=X5M9B8_9HYPH|nr:hydrolase, alpha/beta hydrolase fold family [Candidatus Phaeomarinobacter ectocarpi]
MVYAPLPDSPARPAVGYSYQAERDGRAIEYFANGDGPVVVLMASAGREVSDFNELVTILVANGFRTIAIEAPGIGGSALPDKPVSLRDLAADIDTVLAREKVSGPVVVLGHAFGNRVVRAFAHDHAPRVRAAILIAAGGQKPVPVEASKALRAAFDPTVPADVREANIRMAFFAGDNPIPDYWKVGWYRDTATLQGKSWQQMGDEPWQAAGGVPILVVQADSDTVAPKEDASDVLAEEFAGRVEVALIEDAGHALLPEQPDAIAQAILSYLDRLN